MEVVAPIGTPNLWNRYTTIEHIIGIKKKPTKQKLVRKAYVVNHTLFKTFMTLVSKQFEIGNHVSSPE